MNRIRILCNKSGDRRGAFTLAEMIAVLLLSGLLMVAVVRVLQSVGRHRDVAVTASRDQPALRQLAEQLDRDVTNARTVLHGPDYIQFDGFLTTHPGTGLPTHREGRVVYRIIDLQREPWLIREETALIGTGPSTQREAVFEGVGSLLFERLEDGLGKPLPFPTRARITLRERSGRVVFSSEYQHHSDLL